MLICPLPKTRITTFSVTTLLCFHSEDKPRMSLPHMLDRRTLVSVGVGAIAEHVAKVCQAFGMTTLGISRTPRKLDGFDAIYPRDKLLDAAAQADFLLALVPYTKENDKIINAAVFDVMKPTACLINIARGGLLAETALVKPLP